MKSILMVMAAAGVLVAGGAQASGMDVLKAKGCLGCHDFQKKKVGPAYKDVAAKFKGKAGAEDQLVGMLKSGKSPEGKPHMKIKASDAELHSAVKQVLSTK